MAQPAPMSTALRLYVYGYSPDMPIMISPNGDIRKAIEKIIKTTEQFHSAEESRFYPTQRNWVLLGLTRVTLMIPEHVNLYLADKTSELRRGGYAVLPISVCTPEGLPELKEFLSAVGVPRFGGAKYWDWPYARGDNGNLKPPPARGGTPTLTQTPKKPDNPEAESPQPKPTPVFMSLVFWVPGFTLPWDVAFTVQQSKPNPEKEKAFYTIKDLAPIGRILALSTSNRITRWAIVGIRSAGQYNSKSCTGKSVILPHDIMPQDFITSNPSILRAEAEYLVFSFDSTTATYASELRNLLLMSGIEGWQDSSVPRPFGSGNDGHGVVSAAEIPQDPTCGVYEWDQDQPELPRSLPPHVQKPRGGYATSTNSATNTTGRPFQNPFSGALRKIMESGGVLGRARGLR
ncbi:hypothetical protein DFH27DRAFT_277086 [Peziza echinospora]|nr:hypothetical protein DFH27DRAFT_277086 [Peziza echinospora]